MKLGRIQIAAVGVIASAALLLGACGKDDAKDDATTGTTQEATSGTTTWSGAATDAETVKFDKSIQTQLKDVGCYTGAVDGIIGPATDAAILAFQEAEGLEPDGEFGPETQTALHAAVKAGKKVCGTNSGTTVAPATTTTTAAAGDPPCTAAAVSVVLGSGQTLQSYVCSEGYAGISFSVNDNLEGEVLKAEGTKWVVVTPSPCGAASAGIAPQVLEVGCPT